MLTNNQETKNTTNAVTDINSGVLRIVTAGSVDNGKSTLIGRLLYDSKKILQDQLENIEAAKERYGNEEINLAFLTDGLRAEREQGITIDVAYRYFTSDKRKYILADCPGHIQYTKNMITGASTAEAAIILIDAKAGFIEQSKRHTYLSLLLGVSHIIFAVNKMDLMNFSQDVYKNICSEITDWIKNENTNSDFSFIPISALAGDNIVKKSNNMDWYKGNSLIDFLDNLKIKTNREAEDFRYPVQWVIRPQSKEFHDYRAYAGTIASGKVKVGDEVCVYPGLQKSKVKSIHIGETHLEQAISPLSTSIQLEDDIDISRGSIICSVDKALKTNNKITAILTWLNSKPAQSSKRYLMKHNKRWIKVMINDFQNQLNLHSLKFEQAQSTNLELNGIAKVEINCSEEIYYDLYEENKTTGSFILADESSFETVGAGMIIWWFSRALLKLRN